MIRFTTKRLSFAIGLLMVAASFASWAATQFTATTPIFTQVITESIARTLPAPAADFDWQPLPGANGFADSSFAVIAGSGTLVTLRFTAESLCTGGGTDFNWCAVRILVDGVEASPQPSDFAFDSADNGAEGAGSWEGHAMTRHICIRNPGGAARVVPVVLQWSAFGGSDGVFPSFRLDDWSLEIESKLSFNVCNPIITGP